MAEAPRDPEQQAFLARIREWSGGVTYQTCTTAMKLQAEVVRALNGLAAGVDPAGAATRAAEALREVTFPHQSGFSTGAPPRIAYAWSPVRTAFTISEQLLFEEATGALEEAFFAGPGRLCQQTPKLEVGGQFLSLSCPALHGGEPEAIGRIYLDGTLSAGVGVPQKDGSAFGFLTISPSETERAFRGLLNFMDLALKRLDPERVMQSGMGQSSLSNLGMGQFSEPSHIGGGTIPMEAALGGDRTRIVPADPEEVGRHDLNAEAALAGRIVSRLQRPQ